jgi:hypothetical protein
MFYSLHIGFSKVCKKSSQKYGFSQCKIFKPLTPLLFFGIFNIWAHSRYAGTGLSGVPLTLHSLRERFAPLQSLARVGRPSPGLG